MEIVTRKQAKALGLRKYFSGTICKHGHLSARKTSNGECLECVRSYNNNRKEKYKNWCSENKASIKKYNKKYYNKNRSKILSKIKNTRKRVLRTIRSPEIIKEQKRQWNIKNKGWKNFLTRKRQAQISRATPKWADVEAIKNIYILTETININTGIKHHVDHIIPLQGKLVCGLHIPENLQIISEIENLRKGREFN